jgi:hypothetical protein
MIIESFSVPVAAWGFSVPESPELGLVGAGNDNFGTAKWAA